MMFEITKRTNNMFSVLLSLICLNLAMNVESMFITFISIAMAFLVCPVIDFIAWIKPKFGEVR